MSKGLRAVLLAAVMLAMPISILVGTEYKVKAVDYTFTQNEIPKQDVLSLCINDEYYMPLTYLAADMGLCEEVNPKQPHIIQLVEGEDKEIEQTISKLNEVIKAPHKKVAASEDKIVNNGKQLDIQLLKVNGYNFIKLKDAADFMGKYLYIDDQNKVIDMSDDQVKGLRQEEKLSYKQYIDKQIQSIDLAQLSGKQLLEDSGLAQYPIILLGENHASVKSYDIELFWIKYLNQNAGVRHIFIEEGYCTAQRLNQYLETGDTSILKKVMSERKGTFGGSNAAYQYFQSIYEYNQSLPKDKKIELIGVDVQHQMGTGVDYLTSLLPKKKAPDSIKESIDGICKKQQGMRESIIRLQKDLEKNEDTYKQYLGSEFEHFKLGVKGLDQIRECKDGNFDELREKKMIENFMNEYRKIKGEKCLGIFGAYHINLAAPAEDCNMATYLNTNWDETKNKIASVVLKYDQSYFMNPDDGHSEPLESCTLNKMMAEAVPDDFGLLPLDGKDSIFDKEGYTKAQQYFLIVKNSPAATQYKE